MKVFIGSSTEAVKELRLVAAWIEQSNHHAVPWDAVALFRPGPHTFSNLKRIAADVDAAIFIFSEDDKIWYRSDTGTQPRDNVLVEYGLFHGALGDGRVIFCRKGKPKTATDVLGVTYIDISPSMHQTARMQIEEWLRTLQEPTPGDFLRERLASPFQALGKQSLFWQGTELIKRADRRVALVAKTPIPLVGTRPYDESDRPIAYEQEQLSVYKDLVERSASSGHLEFLCVASTMGLREDLAKHAGTRFTERVKQNLVGLETLALRSGSRFELRWYIGRAPMTFLVVDDTFIIWFKDRSGESVWITAKNEVFARALYFHASTNSEQVPLEESLRLLGLS